MPSPLGIGIIGSGFGADVILPAVLSQEDLHVHAVAPGKSGRKSDKTTLKHSDVPQLSISNLLTIPDVEAIIVAVPPFAQKACVELALSAGKHVLCEKPLTTDLLNATSLCEAARSSNRILGIDYEFRYDPLITSCIDAKEEGLTGKITQINVEWWTGGSLRNGREWSWRDDITCCLGVLTEWCSHVIDYILFITGSTFSDVSCQLSFDVLFRNDHLGVAHHVTTPDGCTITGNLANGIVVTIDVSTARLDNLGHRIELIGDSGRFISKLLPPYGYSNYSFLANTAGIFNTFHHNTKSSTSDPRVDSVRSLVNQFARRIAGPDSPKLPICKDAIAVWRTIEASYLSALSGGKRMNVKCPTSAPTGPT